MRIKNAVVSVVVALSVLPALGQTPLGNEFTYQARVALNGQPLSGTADFQFKLFNALQGGAQVGTTQSLNNVNVADGLVSAPLNFGAAAFNGDQRFLEIAVRSPAGGGQFQTLAPRQPITGAPYALKVPGIDGHSLNAADGSPVDALFVDNGGKVGIGTTTPEATLQVLPNQSGPAPGEGIRIMGTSSDVANQSYLSFSNSAGTAIGYVGDGSGGDDNVFLASYIGDVVLGTPAGRVLTATAGGNVGVGTPSPFFRLTTVADFPSDGVGVIGTSPNAPAFSLGASGHGTSYLGMATDTFNFSTDALPGDLVLLSPVGKRLLFQHGHAGSALAIVGGNIGVGTVAPQAKLDVNGTARMKVLEITGADIAERFPTSEPCESVEPGTVMAIDPANPGKLCIARGAYNRCVAGIVSGANDLSVGAVLGNLPGHENAPPIALSGRVYVRCDASSAAIEPGDLLTTSNTPGHAMKAADHDRAYGAVIGKAMTSLSRGETGMVLVLVSLH